MLWGGSLTDPGLEFVVVPSTLPGSPSGRRLRSTGVVARCHVPRRPPSADAVYPERHLYRVLSPWSEIASDVYLAHDAYRDLDPSS